MPAEILGEKELTSIKTTESILVCTQEVGTRQLQQRKERGEDSFTSSAKQWSNITK